ncbi:P-loop containing nucleoside triphosphate hydrolase protein [Lipomyces oligophaga]|uniref:P-loop containing nucleoside triphosphate hydrolase protein n=1 Tax=Lipomyces oligophaga TaxID=45792 RepID=UPI0034CE4B39
MASAKSIIVLKDCMLRVQHHGKNLYPNPLNLTIEPNERWAITGTHKTQLLQCLAGHLTAVPAQSRLFPFLEKSVWPATVTSLISFDTDIRPTYLAARYEHHREPEDTDLDAFLRRAFHADSTDKESLARQESVFKSVIGRLNIGSMLKQWVVTLSNGQNRRARIARGLLKAPRILLADEPFLGLDPTATTNLSDLLAELPPNPHVILGLRIHEPVPDWITHIAVVGEAGIIDSGSKEAVAETIAKLLAEREQFAGGGESFDFQSARMTPKAIEANTVVDLDYVTIQYEDRPVIRDLKWVIYPGDRWHLRGNNGSGKSTLLSMLTADHPKSWNSKIRMLDEPRRVGKHNYFSINKIIGHASPEIHAIFPKNVTARQAVLTGFTVGSFLPPTASSHVAGDLLKEEREARVNSLLSFFKVDGQTMFSDLTLNDQKVILFLRAIVKNPEILILDEAFSGMNDESIFRCKRFVDEWGGTVIAIGHINDEIPRCDKFIRLHGSGLPAEQGLVN